MAMNMPKIANPFSGALADNNIKKLLEEKRKECSKIYGFIGMDVYDLHKQGRLVIPELAAHFEKIQALEQEIADLEAEKQRRQFQHKGVVVCSCGQKLSVKNAFCPNCGKPVDNGMITCTCGQTISSDLKFCTYCGRNIKEMLESGTKQPGSSNVPLRYRECICGARVPEGQFMCMECGRKLED